MAPRVVGRLVFGGTSLAPPSFVRSFVRGGWLHVGHPSVLSSGVRGWMGWRKWCATKYQTANNSRGHLPVSARHRHSRGTPHLEINISWSAQTAQRRLPPARSLQLREISSKTTVLVGYPPLIITKKDITAPKAQIFFFLMTQKKNNFFRRNERSWNKTLETRKNNHPKAR